MPIDVKRRDLFPDDTNPLPAHGSVEQQRLMQDELAIGNATFFQSLRKLSDVTDDIYPELIGNCLNVLATVQKPRSLRVLDLCAGVGLTSLKLIERDVDIAELTLVDVSSELLSRAREILGQSGNMHKIKRLETTQLDPLVDDLDRFAAGAFDVVFTCNAFQHFPRARQAQLFARLHRLLADDGVFMFASQFKPLRPRWKEFIIEDVQRNLRKHGAGEDVVANAGDHIAQFHNHLNVVDVYNWLEAAGFSFFECVFRRYIIAIFAAVK